MLISFCSNPFNFVLWLSLFCCIARLLLTSVDQSLLHALAIFVKLFVFATTTRCLVLIAFSLHEAIVPLSSLDIFIHAIDPFDQWLSKQEFKIMPYPSDSSSRDRYCMFSEMIIVS